VVSPTDPCVLRSTQPLKVSTMDFSWGKGSRCVWLTTYHPCSAETSRKSGALIYPEPLGPPRPVAGDLYFTLIYSFFNLSARCGGWSTPRPGRFTFGKETRHPFYRRLCGPQGRVGRERKISPPTGIRSPDLPACSESLYRLRYPGLRSSITFLYSTQLQFIWYALLAHLRHAPCNVDLNSLHSLTLTSSQ